MNYLLILAAAIGLSAAPALAGDGQTDAPTANRAVAAQATAQQSSVAQNNADVQAQYQSDVAAYQQSLRQHHRAVRQNRHQQRAYTDAMAAWRQQVYACHHGHNRACNAPTPDPADYY